ncbi:SLC13 family permease [Variovorax sp. OV329]|uniref:SLC13 family permease n=1 Tax=Variovorax sp. OV329 TaxID=1882825 RepID=UPI0008EFD5A1|nr:SLC13 family permease [Variovorax sp. OV329]SFM03620.1 Di-and tricarboxylate transporter [Variovorax sp. OV329]
MSIELLMVLGLLVAAMLMFAWGRPRSDMAALVVMTALPFTGVISVREAIAGFADPNVVLIALLFVLGEGLVATGVAHRMSELIVRLAGGHELRLVVALMVAVATIGSVLSSTGVIAIFIPIVLRIARRTGIAAGRLMMPLSVAALISGMMTLVATPPNLMVHAELQREGHAGFGFLSVTPFGIPILAAAVVYMLFARRWLGRSSEVAAPARPRLEDWIEQYGLAGREYRVRVLSGSPWIGSTAPELESTGELDGLHVLALEQSGYFGRRLLVSPAGIRIEAGTVLLLDARDGKRDPQAMLQAFRLEQLPLSGTYFSEYANEIGMAEMMVPAGSPLIGRTCRQLGLRERHDIGVIGLRHGRTAELLDLQDEPLELGDTLLVVGPWPALRALGSGDDGLMLLSLPIESEDVAPHAARAPAAVLALFLTIALMISGIVPNVLAALLGCLLMGAAGCVDPRTAYRSIHWPTLVLIVGMLPFSLALQRTGGIDLAASLLLELVGNAGPRVTLGVIFVATVLMGFFMSNTAVAVLMAPVALATAYHLGASPYPFAMTVALAASSPFMTPVTPVNALVVGPGGYGFADFLRVGAPLALITLLIVVTLVPILLPL